MRKVPGVEKPDYLKWMTDTRQPVVVIDLRPVADYRAGHLPGARSVPMAELDRRVGEIFHLAHRGALLPLHRRPRGPA